MEHELKIIQVLQEAGWNVLVLFHPSEPDKKRIFVVSQFVHPQNNITLLDLRGKEITSNLKDSSFFTQFPVEQSMAGNEYQRSRLNTFLDEIKERHYKFSPDYSWEWYLAS